MSNKKTFIKNDIAAEILKKARGDMEFKKMLFANPQEALTQFGVVIPGASGKNYTETVYAAFDRAEFYRWFSENILNEFRDGTNITAPGPCVTTTEHEDMGWDFEVTKYEPLEEDRRK